MSISDRAGLSGLDVEKDRLPAQGWFRRIYNAARHLPDRLLHSRRHLAARHKLSQMARPRTILVVCYGNVCRSPYLQAVLQRDLRDIRVTSGGFFGPDRPVPSIALAIGARRGLDLSGYRSRVVARQAIAEADLLIVMDAELARRISTMFGFPPSRIIIAGDLDSRRSATRSVQDPWQQAPEVFEASFDRLDRCARTLVTHLRRRGS